MKPKTMILMVVAIVCGLGASYMTSRLLAERGDGKQETPKVNVLVAKKNLDNGTPLKKPGELFEVKEFLKGQEPRDGIATMETLKGKYLKRNLRKGDFVTAKDIDDNQTILPLPEGKVGVGIRVSAEAIAGGFAAAPGSKVNIVWTLRGNNNLMAQSITLLENVLVVAADTQFNRKEEGTGAYVASVVTVALTEEEALKVNLAKDIGSLSLALRSSNDDSTKGKMSTLTLPDLLKSVGKDNLKILMDAEGNPIVVPEEPAAVVKQPMVQQQPVEAPKAGKKKHIVRIKEGNKIRTQVFLIDEQGNALLESLAYTDVGAPVPAPAVNNPPSPPAVNNSPATPSSGPVNGSEANDGNQPASGPANGSGPLQ